MSFIVALSTDTSTELMSGAKSREWVHHNSTNQPTNVPVLTCSIKRVLMCKTFYSNAALNAHIHIYTHLFVTLKESSK